ncbi:hypothetical protein [Deinococcus sonorensis]
MPHKAKTRVQGLVQGVMEERAARGLSGDLPETKVTLRLKATDAFWLAQLAELMEASRTRTASQLLSAAIRDAVQAAGLPADGSDFREALQAFIDTELAHEAHSSAPGV